LTRIYKRKDMNVHSIRSEQFFTRGCVVGSEPHARLTQSLANESTDDLLRNIQTQGGAFADRTFGGMARVWHNFVVDELHRRNVTEYSDIFGTVKLVRFSY